MVDVEKPRRSGKPGGVEKSHVGGNGKRLLVPLLLLALLPLVPLVPLVPLLLGRWVVADAD